jgi:hypothetical protein
LDPLLGEIESLTERIAEYDRRIEQITKAVYPQVAALKQVKGVGPLCKPAADEPILWQATTPEERRVDRAELCALLRYGWDEKDASAGTPEHSQATFDSRRGVQSELDLPQPVGIWYPTRTEKSTVLVCSYASLAA